MRPAMMTAVMTGTSSLDRARERTPPTAFVSPSLANSLVNCRVQTKNLLVVGEREKEAEKHTHTHTHTQREREREREN